MTNKRCNSVLATLTFGLGCLMLPAVVAEEKGKLPKISAEDALQLSKLNAAALSEKANIYEASVRSRSAQDAIQGINNRIDAMVKQLAEKYKCKGCLINADLEFVAPPETVAKVEEQKKEVKK